jgi:hypothetical protein
MSFTHALVVYSIYIYVYIYLFIHIYVYGVYMDVHNYIYEYVYTVLYSLPLVEWLVSVENIFVNFNCILLQVNIIITNITSQSRTQTR